MNPFEIVINKMISLGFYTYLFPFIITVAIFYALLKKSKVFGESIVINAVVALSIALLVFGFPVIAGVSLASPLSIFFTQATVWILIFVIGILLASFFYPELTKMLLETFKRRTVLMLMLVIGVVLFITSGLLSVFTYGLAPKPGAGGAPGTPLDVIYITVALMIFIVLIIVAAYVMRG
jgi:quinol-cytochrome oxidoreductase complex cytochrome b subunit